MLNKTIALELGAIIYDGIGIGLIGLDRESRIILWNNWMEKHSGVNTGAIQGKSILDCFPSIKENRQDRYILKCMQQQVPIILSPFFHDSLIPIEVVKGDRTIPMKQNIKIFPVSGAESDLSVVIVIQDMTEQIMHEEEIVRLTRILKGIRNVNQLITRVGSEDELFEGSCKILVEEIDYAFAWIGLIEEGTFDLKPAAFAGIENEVMDELKVRWDDSEYGMGATGMAIKTGETQVVKRITEDSLSQPWHAFAERVGYRSTCSVPIKDVDRVIGAFNVHSKAENVFQKEELDLLEEVTGDIAYALNALREKRKRQYFERALADEKERLAVTLRSIGDGVITTGTDGRIVFLNTVAEDLTGWTQAEAQGKPLPEVFNIINEQTRERCTNPVEKVLAKGMIVGLANHTVLIARDGTEKAIGDSGAPIQDKHGKTSGVVLVFRDMTERKKAKLEKDKLQEQLTQSQKMESIGTLTGGIAHDFNNILGIIVGNTELAFNDIPQWNPAHSCIEEIKKASLRATNIVKQLLSFSRKTDQKLQPLEITVVIKDALDFLRSTIPTTVDIQQDIQTKDETILADPTQINQIMMNLCINASHAMEKTGGNFTVKIETVILEDNEAKDYPDLRSGKHVKVTVSDTGPGIEPEIIDRIFEPYFTTKEVGKGSGMGLAVVQGIIKNHNGAISVDSKPGKGTTFNVLFPITIEKPETEKDTTEELLLGTETILFVDDEKSIVKMVRRMLGMLGYQVKTATAPQDALEKFSADPKKIDLVITDMTMPQMTGVKLSEKLMDIRSDIPIIICTGHSALVDEEKAKELGLADYVMKPIIMSEIAQTIRKVLDKKQFHVKG